MKGIRLAYRASGPQETPPLVLVHGLGRNATDWEQVTLGTAHSRRVYALDLRGHGRSVAGELLARTHAGRCAADPSAASGNVCPVVT
ncbi:alpha/beta fold hydrolase [Streptomyces sp. NBC_01497]|uniref:alpha/beta fold hydrolase n=1 Tax=Streptomyces sp. NBC_01497 TaxID=2903885 RepID=UPI002E3122AC|nr:alpha/beta fold hydrolase [Streptomyces sp. NBC_01497]